MPTDDPSRTASVTISGDARFSRGHRTLGGLPTWLFVEPGSLYLRAPVVVRTVLAEDAAEANASKPGLLHVEPVSERERRPEHLLKVVVPDLPVSLAAHFRVELARLLLGPGIDLRVFELPAVPGRG